MYESPETFVDTKRVRILGALHVVAGIIVLITCIVSGIKLNYAFYIIGVLGVLYLIFGIISIVNTYRFNPASLRAFLVWCKSSIVLAVILSVALGVQFYYELYGNLQCKDAITGLCIGILIIVDIVSITVSVVGVIFFPIIASGEDDNLLYLELESLVLPPPIPQEEDIIRRAVIKFNNVSPNTAIDYLIQQKAIKGKPIEIANFLYIEPNLNKVRVGDYLGEYKPLNLEVLKAFTECFDFANMDFDEALRHYLAKFRLPGEAQKIDRIMEAFAVRFCRCNPGIFPSPDVAYVLAFSLIMLNTDAHNPRIKRKMTMEDFVQNNKGIAKGLDLPREILEKLYNNIIKEEIKMQGETLFTRAEKKGWLRKQGNNNRWQLRYFVLTNNCLFYFTRQDEDAEPRCMIPLEGLSVVRNTSIPQERFCFELYDPSSSIVKSLKIGKRGSTPGNHKTYVFACENEADLDSWVPTISNQIVANPVLSLINQKKVLMEKVKQNHHRTVVDKPLLSSSSQESVVAED